MGTLISAATGFASCFARASASWVAGSAAAAAIPGANTRSMPLSSGKKVRVVFIKGPCAAAGFTRSVVGLGSGSQWPVGSRGSNRISGSDAETALNGILPLRGGCATLGVCHSSNKFAVGVGARGWSDLLNLQKHDEFERPG